MTYGQDSPDANYFDDIPDENAQSRPQQAPAQTIDPDKFVPIEKYSALEQQFQQVQPKLETLDRLAQAFNPQAPQYTPEQIAEFQRYQQIAKATVDPELQKIQEKLQFQEEMTLDNNAKQLGFADRMEQEDWYFATRRGLLNKANQGDQQAKQAVTVMEALYNNGEYLKLQNYAAQNFDYLDQHAGRMKIGRVAAQQIGHGFNNSPFKTSSELTPEAYEKQVSDLAKQGKWDEVRSLQQRFASQIQSMI